MKCDNCKHPRADKGRAFDGRRAYRCPQCGNTWTNGLQGRKQRFSPQRESNQFADSKGRWLAENPLKMVRRPAPPAARDRIMTADEIDAALHCLGYSPDNPLETATARTGAALLFAIETAMRMGEICRLRRADISGPVAIVREAKTASGVRRVPLSKEALRIIGQLPETKGPVFGLSAALMEALWRKARDKAGLVDCHFHDSRHTAITRLAKRLPVLDLARMVGHRDLRQLMVYYNEPAEDIAGRLG